MSKYFVFCVVILAFAVSANATIYTRCGLAKALLANGMSRSLLSNWVCLVESESGRNTAAKGGPNSDGSYDYGLYQINSRYWCRVGSAGGDCNIDCRKLIDTNIADDSACARKIYARHGFNAWYGWKAKCQGALPNLSSCNL